MVRVVPGCGASSHCSSRSPDEPPPSSCVAPHPPQALERIASLAFTSCSAHSVAQKCVWTTRHTCTAQTLTHGKTHACTKKSHSIFIKRGKKGTM